MNLPLFTVEEENLICIFNTSSRDALTCGISDAIPHFDEPEMQEIAKSALRKLEVLTDTEFSTLIFHPAYFGDDDDDSEVDG